MANSEEQEPTTNDFYIELPLTIRVPTGLDQRAIRESRRLMSEGVECLLAAERLFWTVRQLSQMKESAGWVYSERDLSEALESISDIGMALANEASDRIQRLEHVCDRLAEKGS
ncbi:MAG: hypothetical protein M3362_19090 [Acidobacteriota bacterium]|nr:hypothetical protein [Acidobacteriota bacterium]